MLLIEKGFSGYNTPDGFVLSIIKPDGKRKIIATSFANGVSIKNRKGMIKIKPDGGKLIREALPERTRVVLEMLPSPQVI